ncbi:bifunctional AP-4-A phosphorylase/ADP sulfurylase [Leucoagaricus gongylophorus]
MIMSVDDIITKIPNQYRKAKESGDLYFFPSTVVRHREPDTDIEFQISVCPALKNKPKPLPSQAPEEKLSDPFDPPYNENLYIGELKDDRYGEEYVVLLNKFSVVPNHFLLVSKEYDSQSSPLLPSDLVLIYKLLISAREVGRKSFAFYNCGNFSGASQPHKHIQFIPIGVTEAGPPIERLARSINLETPTRPFTISRLPYANHIIRLPPDLQYQEGNNIERVLTDAFLSLLDLVVSTIRHAPDYPAGKPSYNVIITLEHMHLIPRRCENFVIPESEDVISINALGFAGMLLVKTDEELEKVKSHGIGLILHEVGLESVHEIQLAGTTDEAVNLVTSHI